jgi:hypothetical protein
MLNILDGTKLKFSYYKYVPVADAEQLKIQQRSLSKTQY